MIIRYFRPDKSPRDLRNVEAQHDSTGIAYQGKVLTNQQTHADAMAIDARLSDQRNRRPTDPEADAESLQQTIDLYNQDRG